jgi:uncharacterized protein with NRDE domain
MCIIAIAWRVSPRYPLLLAANRDEAHARPSAEAGWWDGQMKIFGGRDLVAGGSWLAIDAQGRLGAVTNFAGAPADPRPRSRGQLVRDYLETTATSAEFIASLAPTGAQFAPFNLLVIDQEVHYGSNCEPSQPLGPGVHALSNAPLENDWPKVARARAGMRAALAAPDPIGPLFDLLAEGRADTAEAQGLDAPTLEERRARLFVNGRQYGTRASTVIAVDARGEIRFVEKRFDAAGNAVGTTDTRFLPLRRS